MKTLLTLVCLVAFAAPLSAQCGASGCSSGGAGFGLFRNRTMYYAAPQSCADGSCTTAVYEPPYVGQDGLTYRKYTDGLWRADAATLATAKTGCENAHPCVCGCVQTGNCKCANCNVGCGIDVPPAKKKVTADELPKGIDLKKLYEIPADKAFGWFKLEGDSTTVYWLNREAVKLAKANEGSQLVPVGAYVWTQPVK